MRYLLLIILLLPAFAGRSQTPSPVKWKFSGKKGNNPNEYVVVATATIKDSFHVFAPDPGGDGLLIATEATIKNKEQYKQVGSLVPQRRPITKNMEGVGMVNYYEGEIEFTLTIVNDHPIGNLEGSITFQCCNNAMCLPPADVPFRIKF